jgi:hypothetical protein
MLDDIARILIIKIISCDLQFIKTEFKHALDIFVAFLSP